MIVTKADNYLYLEIPDKDQEIARRIIYSRLPVRLDIKAGEGIQAIIGNNDLVIAIPDDYQEVARRMLKFNRVQWGMTPNSSRDMRLHATITVPCDAIRR